MRFTVFSLVIALLAAFAMAVAPQRSVVISWPNDTPDHIVEEAKEAIRNAKGYMPPTLSRPPHKLTRLQASLHMSTISSKDLLLRRQRPLSSSSPQ